MPMQYYFFLIPGILLAAIASIYTKYMFNRYSRVAATSRMTGAQAAACLLRAEGLDHVGVERVGGFLSDHYDPRTKTLRLSPGVYDSPSLSAIGVACHEAGHAIQHAHHYVPLVMRTALVPLATIGSNLALPMLMIGLFLQVMGLVYLGIIVFAGAVLFSIVTLPVEWDASARAKTLMVSAGIVSPAEQVRAGQVLNAAFLTYVAGALTAVLQLLYFLMRAGLLGGGGRRD